MMISQVYYPYSIASSKLRIRFDHCFFSFQLLILLTLRANLLMLWDFISNESPYINCYAFTLHIRITAKFWTAYTKQNLHFSLLGQWICISKHLLVVASKWQDFFRFFYSVFFLLLSVDLFHQKWINLCLRHLHFYFFWWNCDNQSFKQKQKNTWKK